MKKHNAKVRGSSIRSRIGLPINGDVGRRLRRAAARRGVTVGQYIRGALDERLRADLDVGEMPQLTAKTDPVLAELWDNDRDAAYDRL